MRIETIPPTRLTSPPAVGDAAEVHGLSMTVRAVDGDKVILNAPENANGLGLTTMRWAGLLRREDGSLCTPERVVHDSRDEGVVPMAADDPRWERIRRNASDPTSRQAPGLIEHLTEMYAAPKEG